jgi:hypothetical protein
METKKNNDERIGKLKHLTEGILALYGISPREINEDYLIQAACKITGLSDFGDESFIKPLGIILKSLKEDSEMNAYGWFYSHSLLIGHLSNRLLIHEELKQKPEITEQPIRKPLFIVSLPRTGTTLLQRLLALDTFNRSPLLSEMMAPAPAQLTDIKDTDPRILDTQEILDISHLLMPGVRPKHLMQPNEPEECLFMLEKSFLFPTFHSRQGLPSYIKWLNKQDLIPAYQLYKTQLQILQFCRPELRWVLKCPWHMYSMKALLKVFPDACVISTHRDPNKAISSIISLIASIREGLRNRTDMQLLGKTQLEFWKDMLNRYIEARDEFDQKRFIDVQYKDLVRDPIGTVQKIYEYFGYNFTSDFEERMKEYLYQNPKNKHGIHKYYPEQFGLDAGMIHKAFAEYMKRFRIPKEE